MYNLSKKYKLFLEKFLNLWNKHDISFYIDDVYKIMVESYEPIGGFLTAKNSSELLLKTDLMKIIKRKGNISAVACYKVDKNNNRKLICAVTNQTEQGKRDLYIIIKEDINQVDRNAYTEVSDKLEYIYLKHGANIIPNNLVSIILNKEVELDSDGFHYYREIGGKK